MNVACPSCSAQGSVNSSKLPPEGWSVICSKCATSFHVCPESSETQPPISVAPLEERITCPKCGCEQQKTNNCSDCGIIIEKFLRGQARLFELNRKEELNIKSELRVTDAWYRDLFDRRLTTLMIRVLSMLLLLGLFMTCSANNFRRMANRPAIDVGGSGQTTAQRNAASDEQFKARFNAVVSGLNSNIDQCFHQCYSYLSSPWYLQGDNKPTWASHRHVLTDSMLEEYTNIVTKKRSAASTYSIPTPSPRYYDCYYKINQLFNIYDSLFKYVENYETYHYGFSPAISNLNAEHTKLQEELNACSRSF